ncbi:ABC transporter permease [candidate division CSSED10-310 bacterium]|uniref:ABC transporter permease n=1 Tax=candidate division CSSED10-310 bacterium TaxID=2855610 RepID=A0ABV6YZE9_UNCC1
MLLFQLKRAFQSLLKTPNVTIISILAVTLGVGVMTSFSNTFFFFTQNPLPQKSDILFNVRLDNWTLDREPFDVEPGEPPKHSTYRDTRELMKCNIPRHQTRIGAASSYVFPEDRTQKPFAVKVRLTTHDFFPMFNVPFQFGAGWSQESDEKRDAVIVLSRDSNLKLFKGLNSVGKQVHLGARHYTVVGVLGDYHPQPIFYDFINSQQGEICDFFLPLDHIRETGNGLTRQGDTNGWGSDESFEGDSFFTVAEANWLEFWVELAPERVEEYRMFLTNYVHSQKALGRFPRPMNNRVTPMMEWVRQRNRSLSIIGTLLGISFLFLAACSVNLTGLLLGKFLSAAPQIGVFRAMGAKKRYIFSQYIIECELIAVFGGILGLAVAALGLKYLNTLNPIGDWFHLDLKTVYVAVVLSLVTGFITGLYPAWRACQVNPAIQIKIQ